MEVTVTWADRNPQKPAQPSRHREQLTEAQKATRKIQMHLNREKRRALTTELDAYKVMCEEKLAELAEKFSYKPEYLQRLLHTSLVLKKERRPTLHNAILHMKATEENAGTSASEKIGIITHCRSSRYACRREVETEGIARLDPRRS
jgi:hypothetical protein